MLQVNHELYVYHQFIVPDEQQVLTQLTANHGVLRSIPVKLTTSRICLSLVYYVTPNSTAKIKVEAVFVDGNKLNLWEVSAHDMKVRIQLTVSWINFV